MCLCVRVYIYFRIYYKIPQFNLVISQNRLKIIITYLSLYAAHNTTAHQIILNEMRKVLFVLGCYLQLTSDPDFGLESRPDRDPGDADGLTRVGRHVASKPHQREQRVQV